MEREENLEGNAACTAFQDAMGFSMKKQIL
jgi:hypothetical protein